MEKKKRKKHIARPLTQALSALILNLNVPGFFKGSIYQGSLKGVCVPVLNCYSCPGALGACPIGSLQASFAAIGGKVAYYVLGMLVLFGATLGRFFCGWICPFGWVQHLLHKVPVKKLTIPKKTDRILRYLKYAILIVMVIGLPLLLRNQMDMSNPYFCKYVCPAGILEGGIPLALANASVRASLGGLFIWKLSLMLLILAAAVVIYRPFCKYICPLGAFYGLFAKFSLYRYAVDAHACVNCGACSRACGMGVDPVKQPNSAECIRCGDCKYACPTGAIHSGFCMKKNMTKEDSHEA